MNTNSISSIYISMIKNRYYLYRPTEPVAKTFEALGLVNIISYLKRPILDIGCGDGWFISCWYPLTLIDAGIDTDVPALKKAKNLNLYSILKVENATELSFSEESFNTVISICVIEHIPDVEKVLKEVYRVLKSDGFFIFTVPNKKFGEMLFASKILNFIGLKSFAKKYEALKNKRSTHFHLYNSSEWKIILSNFGFKVEECLEVFPEKAVFLWSFLSSSFFKFLFFPFRVVRDRCFRIADDLLEKFCRIFILPIMEKIAAEHQLSSNGGYLLIVAKKVNDNE